MKNEEYNIENELTTKLSEMNSGNSARIVSMLSQAEELVRIQAMGVCKGRVIEIERSNDPMIIKVHNSRIAIATSLAEQITVEKC